MSTTAGALDAFAPPPGLNYVAAIGPSLTFLLISTICTSMLVPITVVLFLFSTPALRRRPIFIFNVLSLAGGFGMGILGAYGQVCAILTIPVHNSFQIVFSAAFFLCTFLAECILIVRVVAVYPPSQLSLLRKIAIYGTIVLFKLARIANVAVETAVLHQITKQVVNPVEIGQRAQHTPYTRVEWFLQTFDTSFTSILFLLRLHQGTFRRPDDSILHVSETSVTGSYLSRLRAFFWIATSNFVFPVILNIVQLAFAYSDPNFLHSEYIYMVNVYVVILGVLFATIWCSSTRDPEEDSEVGVGGFRDKGRKDRPGAFTLSLSMPRFASRESATETESMGSTVDVGADKQYATSGTVSSGEMHPDVEKATGS